MNQYGKEIRKNNLYEKCMKLGVFLVGILRLDRPGRGTRELQQELISLSAGSRTAVRNYYARKILIFLGILMTGGMLAVICLISSGTGDRETVIQELMRPGYGEGDRKENLQVQVEGEDEVREIEVTVRERSYTDQEKQELLDAALEELEKIIPGENASLDEVRSDLVLPHSLEDGAVEINWLTIPYGIVDEDGRLTGAEEESGTLVELRATLTCSGQEALHTVYAMVYPPIATADENIRKSIEREMELADVRDSHEETVQLPDTADGRKLVWSRGTENQLLSVLALTLVAAVCVYIQMDNEIHKRAEARKQQLLLDYPDLMWKMTMLLGAGLSIKGTFTRISEEYLREKTAHEKTERKNKREGQRYVYEEVTYTCLEMQSGISEAQAYERFGKRCQLPEYIRLGTVLSQNLKKGAKGLTAMLETEAEASLTDRRNHAKKIGEQAGTRLLLPMILMLGIVLTILMVPAFLSF